MLKDLPEFQICSIVVQCCACLLPHIQRTSGGRDCHNAAHTDGSPPLKGHLLVDVEERKPDTEDTLKRPKVEYIYYS